MRLIRIATIVLLACLPVYAQNQKTTQLSATTAPASDTIFAVVVNPGTSPANRKLTIDNLFLSRTGNKNLTAYASLNAAVTAISTATAVVEIPATTTVSSSLTIPSNITLMPTGAGMISVSASQTLTVNGPLAAPLRQIFTGPGAVKFGPHVGTAYPQWFGAVFDNATDDSSAIQKAIDAFSKSGSWQLSGIVEITGAAAIGSTLTILHNGIKLRSQGWGSSVNGQLRGFLRWIGSAGSPMVLIQDCWGSGVEDIRLVGNSAAKPSAAIELRDTFSATHAQDFSYLKNVYIGNMGGYDTDYVGHQFVAGVLCSGTVNGDGNSLGQMCITGCDIGIDIQNPNATTTHIDGITIIGCDTGIRTEASIVIDSWQNGINGVDLEFASPGIFVDVRLFQSEGSGRMAIYGSNADCNLIVRSGSFGVDATRFTPADSGNDRWLIDAGAVQGAVSINIDSFVVVVQGANPKNHVLRIGHIAAGSAPMVRLIDVRGIELSNILLGLAGTADLAKGGYVEILRRRTSGINQHEYARNFINPHRAEDRDLQDMRSDFPGKVNVFGGPHKVKKLFAPSVAVNPTGSGATTYSYRVTALTYDGETEASVASTTTNAASLDSTHYNTVVWFQSQGAYAYRIYGRTSGSEQLLKTLTLSDLKGDFSYRDTGADTPSGAFPTVNSTGNASVEGAFKIINLDDGAGNSEYFEAVYASNFLILRSAKTGTGSVRPVRIEGDDFAIRINGTEAWGVYNNFMLYPGVDNQHDLGAASFRVRTGYFGTSIISPKHFTTSTVFWSSGSGSPEGVVTAPVGSVYTRVDGGAGTTLYVKESGSGNTGWAAK